MLILDAVPTGTIHFDLHFTFFPSTDSFFFPIIRSLSSDPDLINILPGFPIKNSPLQLKFYLRLKAGRDQHVTIDLDVTVSIFQAFARNLSDTFGVEFTGVYETSSFLINSWFCCFPGSCKTNIKTIVYGKSQRPYKHNDTMTFPSRCTAPTEEKHS